MAGFSNPYIKLAKDPEYREVGSKKTPLVTLLLSEEQRRKNNEGKWEIQWHRFWEAKVWGDKANEAMLLQKGDVLDLSAQIASGKNGDYISHRAYTEEETWKDKTSGEDRSKTVLVVNDWEKRVFND